MATITPPSSSYKRNPSRENASASFHTPAFFRMPSTDDSLDKDLSGSKKKVSFGSKRTDISTKANTSLPSSSSNSMRTIVKNTLNSDNLKIIQKTQSIPVSSTSTAATTNKKMSRGISEGDTQKAQPYGKRRIYFPDNEDFSDDECQQDSPIKAQEMTGLKKYKLATCLQLIPKVEKMHFYNFSGTQKYEFPVFRESDLKYNKEWQNTLKETEIDNDCETGTEILEVSMKQASADLSRGIREQKELEGSKRKVVKSSKQRSVQSQQSTSSSGVKSGDNKTQKNERNTFFSKVSQSLRELFSQ